MPYSSMPCIKKEKSRTQIKQTLPAFQSAQLQGQAIGLELVCYAHSRADHPRGAECAGEIQFTVGKLTLDIAVGSK
jgi:hypothetical protein